MSLCSTRGDYIKHKKYHHVPDVAKLPIHHAAFN